MPKRYQSSKARRNLVKIVVVEVIVKIIDGIVVVVIVI